MQTSEIQSAFTGAGKGLDRSDQQITDFLAFLLGEDACCIDFEKVCDLITCDAESDVIAGLTQTKSLVDYQGIRLPVVDMRLGTAPGNEEACTPILVVLQLDAGLVGMIVDGVTGVCRLTAAQISPVPDSPILSGFDYFKGLALDEDRMLIVVDVEHLMSYFNMDFASLA
ncbi:MAG: chemotaxis protein CheW [Burkholderiales bacterium]|nr:chemotaxis protein CheW [Burkholderiales bacterium]